jgi:hypothetical protein
MLLAFNKSLIGLSLIASSTLLLGCGGSSGGGNTVTPPPVVVTNTAPVVTGEASPTVAENQTIVGTYTATDAQGDAITFALGGADAALFSIDADGNLSFITAPDFDNGEVGPYTVVIVATDDGEGNLSSDFTAQVSVSNEVDPSVRAVVQTIAPDFVSGSEVVFMDGQSHQVSSGFYIKARTDYTIDTYRSSIYHIGSFQIDTIDKYDASNPETQIWDHTTQDSEDPTSRNPYALISVSQSKAYLLRYGSDKVWIVNPQSQQPEGFKTGELDLSAYNLLADDGENPNAAAAVIADGKLFIAMQRFSGTFSAGGTAYVAVFDTTTDAEIETNANSEDAVKGIPLTGTNPLENSLISANGKVYVTTSKSFLSADLAQSRIEEIDLTDYSVRDILNATDIENNTAITIKGSAIVSAEKGYFYTSLFDENFNETSSLFEFNPTTGAIIAQGIGNSGNEAINHITLDKSNILWVSAAFHGAPGVDLIDTATNTKIGSRMLTELDPGVIRFVE